jgi:hypothetical protein
VKIALLAIARASSPSTLSHWVNGGDDSSAQMLERLLDDPTLVNRHLFENKLFDQPDVPLGQAFNAKTVCFRLGRLETHMERS